MNLDEAYQAIKTCSRCGFCQEACPTYLERGVEWFAARGRLALVRAVIEKRIPLSDDLVEPLYSCLMCQDCTTRCSATIKTPDVMAAAREALFSAGKGPQSMATLEDAIARFRNIRAEDNANRGLWLEDAESAAAAGDVFYFGGCVASMFPAVYGVPRSTFEVIRSAGVRMAIRPESEWCCGYPLIVGGAPAMVDEVMRHNIDLVKQSGAGALITSCPSCYHVWKHEYAARAGDSIDFEILHTTEYVSRLIRDGKIEAKPLEMAVVYHDPCDLGRKNGIFEPPRDILKGIPGLELKEFEANRDSSQCCGGGGNIEMNYPDLSHRIAVQRLTEARDSGARVIATACPQCARTLGAAARKEKAGIRVMDVTEILSRALED